MRFHYTASESGGKIIEGEMEAQGTAEVLAFLTSRDYKPINVKTVKDSRLALKKSFFSAASITENDKIFLTKYLGLMLKVGTDLFQAVDVLINDFDKSIIKTFLGDVRATLEKGQPFYSAFAKYPQFFDSVFVNLIKAGEASGNLDKILEDMSVTLEKKQKIKSRIRGVLVYPLFLLGTSFFILFFLVTFALPKIAGVFEGGGFEPPLFSRIVFAVGAFFGKYALLFVGLLAAAIIAIFYFYKTSVVFRRLLSNFVGRLPAVSGVVHKLALQRFAATLASLIKAGLPLTQAVEITAEAVGHEGLKSALLRISREGITKGLTISDAFRKEAVFPRVVVNLVAISEKAGHLDDVLTTLGNFYDTETDTAIKFMVSLLEPTLLLLLGALVGLIALAIIVPIYQLTGKF